MKKELINESILNRIVEDTMDKFLQMQAQRKQWAEEDENLYNEFYDFLTRRGIPGINKRKKHNGSLCLSIDSDIYNQYNVYNIANKFAEMKGMYLNDDEYPATTLLWLNRY